MGQTLELTASDGHAFGAYRADPAGAPKGAIVVIQLQFGEKDQGSPLENVDKIRQAKSDVDIFVYDGAGHGFVCDERASYSEAATNQARTRTLDFFASNL